MRTTTSRRTVAALLAATAAAATALVGLTPAASAASAASVVPDGVYAFEDFRRTSGSGWGAAATGGSWTHSGGAASDFALDGSGGASISSRGAGWHLGSMLQGASATNTEVRTKVALNKRPAAGSVDVDVVTRSVPSEKSYLLRTKIFADGRVRASLIKTEGRSTTSLAMAVVPNLTYTDGTVLKVRAQTAGRGGTTHRGKVWAEGTPEPADWTVNVTDWSGGLVAGSVGVRTYTSGSVTNLPIVATFTGFSAGPPGGTPDASLPAPRPKIGTYVPDASNTGVPRGTKLTVHHGDLEITKANTVIDGLDIRGVVAVKAKGVVIKNSIIRGKATNKQTALVTNDAHRFNSSVTIEDSELYNAHPGPWIDGIRGSNITVRRVNLHSVIDMVHIYGGDNVTIEGSYLHDNLHFTNDPAQGGTPSHDDSIQIQEGKNIRIFGNNISGAHNTGIQFTQDRGLVSNVTIEKNFLDGGGCSVNLAEKGKGPFRGIVIKDNEFGRNTRVTNCAIISPPSTVLTVSGNYFVDGAVANVRKGA